MQPKWIVSLVGCEVICVELTEEVVGDSENRAQRGFDNGEDVDEVILDATGSDLCGQWVVIDCVELKEEMVAESGKRGQQGFDGGKGVDRETVDAVEVDL